MHLPGMPMIGQHDQAPPTATPTGYFEFGIANAAASAVGEGDVAAPSYTLNRNLRVLTPKVGVPITFTDGSLAAGTSTVTFRTVPAGRLACLTSCIASYTGTANGVSLQLLAGGVEVDLPISSLGTAQFVYILTPGTQVWLSAAAVYAVTITNATLNDDLNVRAQFLEEVI
jgi:hypothetical protein